MNSWLWKPMGQMAVRVLLAPTFLVTNPKIDNVGEARSTFILP